jgi:undecaprenyl-diphosphatase
MNGLDPAIVHALNHWAHRSEVLDGAVRLLAWNDMLKGGFAVALVWWVWFRPVPHRQRVREIVLATLLTCFAALLLGRALAQALPFRLRPIQDLGFGFVPPYGADPKLLEHWSSMPSDHAILFVTLAVGLLRAAPPFGAVLLLHALFVVCLPRVYLGLHWPSDILVGAAIGTMLGIAGTIAPVRARIAAPLLRWTDRHPGLFHALFFALSFQVASLFVGVRDLLGFVVRVARSAMHHWM